METSNAIRFAMLAVIFLSCCIIAIVNLRNIIRFLLRRPVKRAVWVTWAVLGLIIIGCVIDTLYVEPNWVKVSHNTLETSKLPAGAHLRIVQLSDLHLEGIAKRERRMLYLTKLQQPDIIVLTGDYLNEFRPGDNYDAVLENTAKQLTQIAPVYAISGNWDSESKLKVLARSGVHVLKDWTAVRCKGGGQIALGPVHWVPNGTKQNNCPKKMARLYKVMLCHIPQMLPADCCDLGLVGHTHGGQVRFPIFGALLPDQDLVGKYQRGLYQHGSGQIYVNSGIGMEGAAPQVRFCCRPEVAVFDIEGR